MNIADIVPNAFLDNLGTDWVAIDRLGHPVCRAATKEAVERAAPDAVAFMTGKDLTPAPQGLGLESVGAELPAEDIEAMAAAEAHAAEGRILIDDPAIPQTGTPPAPPAPHDDPFDHDGNGRPGGAPKGGNRKRKPAK